MCSIPVGCSGEDPSDEFCIAGTGGEGPGRGWFMFPHERRQHQSMTSDACARRTLLCGFGTDTSATRYLRAPRMDTVYARVGLDEISTRVVPNDGLSKAKRNISADELFISKIAGKKRVWPTGDHRLRRVPNALDNSHAVSL